VPLPGVDADVPVWLTFFTVATTYVFAGATVIYVMIEAAKALAGKTTPSLPDPSRPALPG
jgi:hypothetical protein